RQEKCGTKDDAGGKQCPSMQSALLVRFVLRIQHGRLLHTIFPRQAIVCEQWPARTPSFYHWSVTRALRRTLREWTTAIPSVPSVSKVHLTSLMAVASESCSTQLLNVLFFWPHQRCPAQLLSVCQ